MFDSFVVHKYSELWLLRARRCEGGGSESLALSPTLMIYNPETSPSRLPFVIWSGLDGSNLLFDTHNKWIP